MAVIRNTATQTARHRALDPLMLDSVLNSVFAATGLNCESSISAFIDRYNSEVLHDSAVQLSPRTAIRQWHLRSAARPGSNSQDKSSMRV